MAKSSKQRKQTALSLGKQYFIGFFLVASVLVFSLFAMWEAVSQPFVAAKQEAAETATAYAGLTEVISVEKYNGSAAYFSVQGVVQDGQEVWVLVPTEGATLYLYPKASGISRQEAGQVATEQGAAKVERTVLGIENDRPVWEVKSGTAYYLIDFETGNMLKKEGL